MQPRCNARRAIVMIAAIMWTGTAWAQCGPGSGSCFEPNGTPGCDDVTCCELICGQDPFCCDVEWDQICADAANEQCSMSACGPRTGPCEQPNGTPGCDDVECCELICSLDPFCCEVEWDQICADAAIAQCPSVASGACCLLPSGCIVTTPENCKFELGGIYFGDNSTCADAPCTTGACCIDQPFGGCLVVTEAECTFGFGGVYLGDDTTCDGGVCGIGACCVDGQCLLMSPANCAAMGGAYQGDGSECFPPDLCLPPGACCVNGECFLSNAEFCALSQGEFFGNGTTCDDVPCGDPGPPCNPDAGPCDQANGTPGCDDIACCELICLADPFCCDVEWDQICADAAIANCTPEPTGACCLLPSGCLVTTMENCKFKLGGIYIADNTTCDDAPCAVGACCFTQDFPTCTVVDRDFCENVLIGEFIGDGTTCEDVVCDGPGICCLNNGGCVFILQSECEAQGGLFQGDDICELACPPGVCCLGEACVIVSVEECDFLGGSYLGFNATCEDCACPADFDGSGDVGASDLASLLAQWGPCAGCPEDLDGTGDVNAADLAILLAAWGPCEG